MKAALTFHRIINKDVRDYEDVRIEILSFILDEIGKNCVLPEGKQAMSNDLSWILTFDDGLISDYEIAYPLLKHNNVSAIFFIVPSYIGSSDYLSWDQVRKLSDNGMEIGSHSLNHNDLSSVSSKRSDIEIIKSKSIIEDKISKKVRCFSFPYGRYNNKIINNVLKSGYDYCFTSKPGLFNSGDVVIPRISLNNTLNNSDIAKIIDDCEIGHVRGRWTYAFKENIKNILGMDNYWRLRNLLIKKS